VPLSPEEDIMRTGLIAAALVVSLPVAAQQRGAVSEISASPAGAGAAVEFTVRGTNPCGAIHIDHGDGQAVTYPIRAVPATVSYRYARAGTYQVRARGMGNCNGEASTTVRVAAAAGQRGNTAAELARFEGMDRNNDGIITRAEWRGSAQSFRVHDWNNDGMLSGDEVRPGARRPWDQDPDFASNRNVLDDWTERRFLQLDANRDGRIARREWVYSGEAFLRADRNRDGALTREEFLDTTIDDDREDEFDYLDLNGNNRIELDEWHASRQTFQFLDRNGDGVLTRVEAAGQNLETGDRFATLDLNNDRTISLSEWQWSQPSFTRLDRNGDGRLTRAEFDASGPLGPTGASTPIVISGMDRWTDTGIFVNAGDVLSFTATGSIQMSTDGADVADPAGARSGRRAPNAPMPNQPAGLLLARIGNSAPIAIGGRTASIRAPQGGRLYLGINDDHLADNTGEFRVTVRRGR
jgi:Ca2+-binding EF-hand superfamily protein